MIPFPSSVKEMYATKVPAPTKDQIFGGAPTPVSKILIAKKSQHKGAMFGHISNGGGSIDLGNGYSLGIVANDSQFITLQLFHHAIDAHVSSQSWQKSKIVVEKKVEAKPIVREIKTIVKEKSLL